MFETPKIHLNTTVNPEYSLTDPSNTSKLYESEVTTHLMDNIQSEVTLKQY